MFLELLRSETAASADRRTAALAGLRLYQHAERPSERVPPPSLAESGRARLCDYGGSGRPVVFVPSLINPPFVLDLAEHNSLMQHVARSGFRALLVDWGTPTSAERDEDIGDHVERLLLPMIDTLDEPPILVGYCLGGTMAIAAACLRKTAGLALIAAPWRFSGFGDAALSDMDLLWHHSEPACDRLGLIPMEVLQSGFWRLDPARTIGKFERLSTLDPASDEVRAFVALEDWANGGAPLTYAAGRQLFDDFLAADITGRGQWRVAGERIEPRRLRCRKTEFVSATDRIVPAATSPGIGRRRPLDAGHVGMIIGGRARAQLWNPLLRWLRSVPAHI